MWDDNSVAFTIYNLEIYNAHDWMYLLIFHAIAGWALFRAVNSEIKFHGNSKDDIVIDKSKSAKMTLIIHIGPIIKILS